MARLLISALTIVDYLGVRDVRIKPDADAYLILLGGKNRAGKTSTLNALNAAFGGAKAIPGDPVRHGATEARVHVELDNGMSIDRVIHPDGSTELEVRDAEGAVRRPQFVLDQLVGERFLDPLAFLRLSAKEQLARIMKLIPGAQQIAEINETRERAFNRRREIGQSLTKAKGELARLVEIPVGQLTDVGALTAEQREFGELQRAGEAAGAAHRACVRDVVVATDKVGAVLMQIEDLRRAIGLLEERVPALQRDLDSKRESTALAERALISARDSWQATSARRVNIDELLARANHDNAAVFEARGHNRRRADAAAAVSDMDAEYRSHTAALETHDMRKAEILAAAKMPVAGMTIGAGGILLPDLEGLPTPFSEAAASQQWSVALALAIAGSPGLDDVWIKDGVLLDEESLQTIATLAEESGKRVWVERVGTMDPGVIVIQDGRLAEVASGG